MPCAEAVYRVCDMSLIPPSLHVPSLHMPLPPNPSCPQQGGEGYIAVNEGRRELIIGLAGSTVRLYG